MSLFEETALIQARHAESRFDHDGMILIPASCFKQHRSETQPATKDDLAEPARPSYPFMHFGSKIHRGHMQGAQPDANLFAFLDVHASFAVTSYVACQLRG